MRIQEPHRAALHLAAGDGFGPQAFQALLRAGCANALAMMEASEDLARDHLKPKQLQAWAAARQAFQDHRDDPIAKSLTLLEHRVQLVVRGEERYPAALGDLPGAPILLFVSGAALEALARPCAAIVGTREASHQGLETARHLAAELARHGVTVVSGAAHGIDSAAHEAAVGAGGLTVAVLGSALGDPGKDSNMAARHMAAHHGGCLSEYLPDAEAHPGQYPQRNRVISGVSGVVIVVEGDLKSGARLTANAAIAQGRPLLAVPGDIREPGSALPNALLKGAARAITGPADALAALGLEAAPPSLADAPAPDTLDDMLSTLLASLPLGQPTTVDDVVQASGISSQEVSRGLLQLELMGLCRRSPGGAYARNG